MPDVIRLIRHLIPNPWAAASREGRAVRLRLLADMAGRQLRDANPETMLRILVERAPEDLGLDVCLSFDADLSQSTLNLTYRHGISDAAAAQIRTQRFGEGACGRVAVERKARVIEGVAWSDDEEASMARRNGLHAYACFPLLSEGGHGELLGVLTFGSRRVFRFTEEDVEFFATVASHAAAVHERNRSDCRIKEREQHFRTLADSIPQLAWMARPDGWIFWYNKRWHDFTGTTLAEMEGWGWRKIHHPDHLERVTERFRQSLDTGTPWEDTFPMRGKDGNWRWFLSRALPLRDAQGRIEMWFGTNTDITEQRAAEEDLRRAKDEAEAARREAEQTNRSKSKFLAAASHDLRQPVQSMLLLASVLEGQVANEKGRETLRHLQRGMDALKSLIDGLLDVSRLDAGVVVPEVRDFRLYELFDQLNSTFRPVATGKGLNWRVKSCDAMVKSDPTLLGRILRNLLENAVRYTQIGEVSLSCTVEGGTAVIIVEDTGIGIPAMHLDSIWDEFHQVGNPERDRCQGTGLGLAIVRRLTGLLDHPIEMKSVEGQGSRFVVRVPLGDGQVLGEASCALGKAGDAVALIIDDDAMVLLGLQALFTSWGYDVLIAGSGDRALEEVELSARKPDVVVSDYRLRNGEVGTEAIARVRACLRRDDLPGILLTGESGREAEIAATEAGLGFIHKPVTPRQLAAAMETALGGLCSRFA